MKDQYTWTVYRGMTVNDITAHHISYERDHVVFKAVNGVTVRAYRSSDVGAIVLKSD